MTINIIDRGEAISLYLDWFNNFLTIPRFAEYYGFSEAYAAQVIAYGREVFNAQSDSTYNNVTVTKA